MQLNRDSIIKGIIGLNLLILLVLPQLNDVHYDPLPQFWAEATFAYAAICLFLVVCFSQKTLSIPNIVLPLMIFAIFLVIQPQLVHVDFIGLSYVASIEFVICILLAISVNTLKEVYGISYTVTLVSYVLIIGALLQSLIGLIQYLGLAQYFNDWIFYDAAHPTTNIFGHFGQRNHYCHYLTWATFALIYLHNIKKINHYIFYPLIAWLTFSITISGSRSVFIYFAIAIAVSLLYLIINRDRTHKILFATILFVSIFLFAFEYLYPVLQKILNHQGHFTSGFSRILSSQTSGGGITGRRMIEWEKAEMVFNAHSIVGIGFNQFANQSVALHYLFPNSPNNDGLFTNCHNLVLQLLAETGIIGTLIVVFGILYSIYGVAKLRKIEGVIILCMIGTTLAHSMVEYPLWYIYFLGPFIMFLSIDKPLFKLSANSVAGISMIPVSLLVYILVSGCFIFNTLVAYSDAPSDKASFISQGKYLEDLAKTSTLWRYPALYCLDNYINIDTDNTNALMDQPTQLGYENQFGGFHPYPDNLIKMGMLNLDLGHIDLAKHYIDLAITAFPVYKRTYLKTLKDKKYKELYDMVKQRKVKSI